MKKALILTTSTGQGHNAAANAIIEELENNDYQCIKYDFLAKTDKVINGIVIKGYDILATKTPRIYGYGYKWADNRYTNKILHFGFHRVYKKLCECIENEKIDIIIATHPLAVNIIEMIKKSGFNIPAISVVTDFKAHYAYISKKIDGYITASNYTKATLTSRGVDEDKINTIGIPIDKKFYHNNKNIDKDDDHFKILLMGGSMGLNGISYVMERLVENKNKLEITVVCGRNEKLKNSLMKFSSEEGDKIIRILGFSNEVDKLMDECDLLISKPGGITVTESIVKKVPLVIPFAIPGQEIENVSFLTSHGLAYYINDYNEIGEFVDRIISNPKSIEALSENMSKIARGYSVDGVVNLSDKLIEENNSLSIAN